MGINVGEKTLLCVSVGSVLIAGVQEGQQSGERFVKGISTHRNNVGLN